MLFNNNSAHSGNQKFGFGPCTIKSLLRVALVFKYQLLFKTVLHFDALS